ncbi:tetratricopeptide repeat protein [Streptomyces althioticus]|uniref:tetratricopeptide repeat protein n=1 Tax=Streptomyces althioticus TaxID=83380 RepID=UPI0036BB7F28
MFSRFSRAARRPTSPELVTAWERLDAGDVPGALRLLRQADAAPLEEVALVVGRAAATAGFDDLRTAASALSAHPDRPQALYDYGYACVERGVSHLAIPALREALRLTGSVAVLRELVSAYEEEGRHRDAADALLAHEAVLADWPGTAGSWGSPRRRCWGCPRSRSRPDGRTPWSSPTTSARRPGTRGARPRWSSCGSGSRGRCCTSTPAAGRIHRRSRRTA